MRYDKEEKDIIDAYEKGNMNLVTPSISELQSIKMLPKVLLKRTRGLP